MRALLTVSILFVGHILSAQTTLRVNNTPSFNAPYTRLRDAVAAASSGDIIQLDGSQFQYDDDSNATIDIHKKLTIIGPGYFLDQNAGIQAGRYPAFISPPVQFSVGSEGSSIQGVSMTQSITVLTSNLTINHNNIVGVVIANTTPASNLVIHANDFSLNVYNYPCIQGTGGIANDTYTNILISNNILQGWMYVSPVYFGVLINNHFSAQGPNNHTFGNLDVANTVIYNPGSSTISFQSSSIQNNLFCGNGFPALDPSLNNKTGQDINAIYNLGQLSTDGQYMLKAGSPAAGAGIDGVDAGPFGGPDPYTLSGVIQGNPAITNFIVPSTVPQNGTLNVKVSAKSN